MQNYKFIERIFSLKNCCGGTFKVITILGLQIKIPRKVRRLHLIEYDLSTLKFKKAPKSFEMPIFETPLVSIVIPVYNNYKLTKNCLWSILKNVKNVSYEVIIADDLSSDKTAHINNYIKNLKIVRNTENLGFLKNCNNASTYAKGKYLVFLNNDTIVLENWLESLVDTLERDDSIGLVGSKLVYSDGTLQEAGGIMFRDANGANYGRSKDFRDFEYNYTKEVDYISGCSIMLKRDLWQNLNGFDETFAPAYYEDTDLAFRIRYEKGLKIVYQPKSACIHLEGKTCGTDMESGVKAYQKINKEKFCEKWKEKLSRYHVSGFEYSFLAKDYTHKKKRILVIDSKVPSYSKDSGSRVTWQYMKFFKKQNMNVKLFPHYLFKEENFIEATLNEGFEIITKSFEEYIRQEGKYLNYIFLNRPELAKIYLPLLKKYTNAKILYQCHDLHYLRQYRERLLNNSEDAEELLQKEKAEEFEILKNVDVACSVSSEEVRIIKEEDNKINALQIPIFLLDEKKMSSFCYQPENRNDIMFVAGFNHTPNVDGAVWFIKEIFPIIKKEIPDIKFYLVGSNPKPEILELENEDVIITGYVSDEELEDYYKKIKLTIAPLRYGAGVKGKIIESLYNKVPVVTTSIGIEGIPNKNNIIEVADTPETFAYKVINLYNNNVELNNKSLKAENFISSNYTEKRALESFSQYVNFDSEKEEICL